MVSGDHRRSCPRPAAGGDVLGEARRRRCPGSRRSGPGRRRRWRPPACRGRPRSRRWAACWPLLDVDAERRRRCSVIVAEVAGQADERRVEAVEVGAQRRRVVAGRVGGHEAPRRPASRCSVVEPGHRRGEVGHHHRADVGAVGVAEEDQGQRLVGARRPGSTARRRCRSAAASGTTYGSVEDGAVHAVVVATGDDGRRRRGLRTAAGERQDQQADAATAATPATHARTPAGQVLRSGPPAPRSPAPGSSAWSSRTRTNAEPTITPSAYAATSAAWAPVPTPRPTPIGRSVTARVRATSGPARSLVVVAGAGHAHHRGGVDEAAAGRRGHRDPLVGRRRRDQEDLVEVVRVGGGDPLRPRCRGSGRG